MSAARTITRATFASTPKVPPRPSGGGLMRPHAGETSTDCYAATDAELLARADVIAVWPANGCCTETLKSEVAFLRLISASDTSPVAPADDDIQALQVRLA